MWKTVKRFMKTYARENETICEYFDVCIATIDKDNLYMLRRVCMYISMVYAFLVGLALLIVPNFHMTFADILVIPIILIYFNVNLYTRKPTTHLSTNAVGLICGGFYLSMCLTYVLMDVVSHANSQAIWTPIALVVFPMVYIDRMYKYGIEELFIIIVFGILSMVYKDPALFTRDMFSMVAAYIVAMITAHIILEMRSREGLAMVELKRMSSLDKLTHVLNKDALLHRIENYYAQKEIGTACAMAIIDLDDFKLVNDNLGHNAGDLLLERVGKLLKDSFRAYDIIGRYGGDEFVALMPNMSNVDILEARFKYLEELLQDFCLGNGQPFSASIGAVIDCSSYSWKTVFGIADDALYMSKLSGKATCTTWVIEDKTYPDETVIFIYTQGINPRTRKLIQDEKNYYPIITASKEKEALRSISQYHNNLGAIILEMDEFNEFKMIMKYLKTREGFAKLPVLAIAAYENEMEDAKELGADEVILSNAPYEQYKDMLRKLISM